MGRGLEGGWGTGWGEGGGLGRGGEGGARGGEWAALFRWDGRSCTTVQMLHIVVVVL